MIYKGFTIAEKFQATSQNPGEGWSVAEAIRKSVDMKEILSYKNDAVVYRISKDGNLSLEEAEILFTDMKKFLWLSAGSEKNTVPPPLVDEAWHSFILFTKDYSDFCHEFFGQFIHHLPHRPEDPILGPEDVKPTIDSILLHFGEKPSKNWDYVNIN